MGEQTIIFTILLGALALFIYGRWRYDFVAILALLAATVAGLIPAADAFLGFGHPAVITVGAVFALSAALQNAGVVDAVYKLIANVGENYLVRLTVLNVFIAAISGFMNNIGALAILLPVTMQMARKAGHSSSEFLMPVAFSALLGGMITMIGTPPNIIVATMRSQEVGEPFGMFDFTPVGVGITLAGVAFLSLLGWRLIPERKGQRLKEELFEVEGYLTELKVEKDSECIGKTIREFEELTEEEAVLLGIVRKKKFLPTPSASEEIKKGDILVVEADSETLEELVNGLGVKIMGDTDHTKEILDADDVTVVEALVRTDSPVLGKEIGKLRLRWRFGVSLLAVARAGRRIKGRLRKFTVGAGDILLLRGPESAINDALPTLGCLPLQHRGLSIGEPRRILLAVGIFGLAVLSAALGVFPIQIAFVLAVIAMHFTGLLRLRDLYESIDWPIIILVGAMIPFGKALESTGAAQSIAEGILSVAGGQHHVVVLAIVLVGTMFLSDLVNNATAAVLMVPIAVQIARGLGSSPDPLLMGVAVGASCPFLTPIGHQCNAIILGPGGYRFGDYWRVGLPLEVLITAVGIPLILYVWPFFPAA